jgi:YD repeat-containing protein
MRVTYDAEVDALYIRFLETTVTTKHLAKGIAADYDAEGHLAGIEILDALTLRVQGNALAAKMCCIR